MIKKNNNRKFRKIMKNIKQEKHKLNTINPNFLSDIDKIKYYYMKKEIEYYVGNSLLEDMRWT